jgi:hypothetical protein
MFVFSPRGVLLPIVCAISLGAQTRSPAQDTIYDNGGSGRVDGWEMTRWVEADDFTLATAARVSGVTFWSNAIPGSFAGTIYWEIYTNNPGNYPGTLVASGYSQNVSHTATGVTSFGPFREFLTTFDIAPVALQPGRYWLALHNGPESNNTTADFFWAATARQTGFPSHNRVAGAPTVWFSNAFPGLQADLAFQVRGTPAPPIDIVVRDGIPTIRIWTVSGAKYRLEYKNSMSDPDWVQMPNSDTTGTGGVVEVADGNPRGRGAARFYRAVLQ